MVQKISVGLLDFGYRAKMSPGKVLQDCIDYVTMADTMGFPHYWLGEHHGEGRGWSSPEMLLPVMAGITDRINIGVAGILLKYYRPYQVALNFKLLATLFPGRIDLGLANGAAEGIVDERMNLIQPNDNLTRTQVFRQLSEELMTYFNKNKSIERYSIVIPPENDHIPAVWRLSRSFNCLKECLDVGLNLCISTFHAGMSIECSKESINEFRQQFYKAHNRYPKINIAIAGIYAKNKQLAQSLEKFYNNGTVSNYLVMQDMNMLKEKLLQYYEQFGIADFTFLDLASVARDRYFTLEQVAGMNTVPA